MNAVSLNNLWIYLSGLSLTDNNKDWLSDKLIESKSTTKKTTPKEEALKHADEILGAWASEDFPTAEDLYSMRKSKHTIIELMRQLRRKQDSKRMAHHWMMTLIFL